MVYSSSGMKDLPVLLLHGALGAKDQLEPLRSLFGPKAFSMNFSGHGGLPIHGTGYDMSLFTEDVIRFLDEQKLPVVNIFGYSMGGYVALKLAQLHPGRVNSIFTLGTKFDWTPASAEKEVKQLDPARIVEKVPRFAQGLEQRHAPQDWKKVLAKTAEMMLALGNGAALGLSDFQQVTHPVTIAVGSDDAMVTTEESVQVANALVNGRFESIPGFKHPIELVDSGVLYVKVRDFFEGFHAKAQRREEE